MRISRLIQILIAGFVILASMSILTAVIAARSNDRLNRAYEQKSQLTQATHGLYQATADLSRWAREYVVTGNQQKYMHYVEEISTTRRKEKAAAVYDALDAPQAERGLIQQALNQTYALNLLEEQAFSAVAEGDRDRAVRIIYSDEYTAGVLSVEDTLNRLSAAMEQRTQSFLDEHYALAGLSETLAIVSAALFGVLGVIGVLLILRKIAPINDLVSLLRDVSDGNMNVNLKQSKATKDEIGRLTRYVVNLINVIRGLVDDLEQLSYAFTHDGDLDYRIDENKYNNTFKELMNEVNGIIDSQCNDILPMIQAVNQMADGDFNVTIKDLPGKKMVLPRSIRAIAEKLSTLDKSIYDLAEKASQGELSARIDTSKFSGNWAVLTNMLNDLVDAVERPLADIEHNIAIMSQGDFSHLEGTYPGTFGRLQKACNDNNDITQAYIDEIAQVLQSIAQGDLTVSLKQNFVGSYAPIQAAITTILENLNSTLADVRTTTEQVALGAGQIATGAVHLAEGATRQNAAIEELYSSISLIHEKSIQASDNAKAANESTTRAKALVAGGGDAVKDMADIMNKVKASSESIAKIIDVITNIAFQTNLLALNASVEAARAGEHGKGFSVVANEVRSLAGRSQQSASETSEIIIEDVKNVDDGLQATREVVASFETVSDKIGEIYDMISHIAEISGDQLASISNINDSVSEITDEVTNTSATAEESASASQELSSMAEMLRHKVSFFKLKQV